MRIYLVRHGEAEAGWGQSADPGLSALGKDQAIEVASSLGPRIAELSDKTDVRLVSSPLRRAFETATPLAETLNLKVDVDDAFREIPSPVPLAQRQDWLRSFMRQRWPEQDATILNWRESAWQGINTQRTDTVVFTHFLVINALVGLVGERAETCHFYPDNGSVTELQFADEKWQVAQLGREMQTLVN